jgi:hypothetical protein
VLRLAASDYQIISIVLTEIVSLVSCLFACAALMAAAYEAAINAQRCAQSASAMGRGPPPKSSALGGAEVLRKFCGI